MSELLLYIEMTAVAFASVTFGDIHLLAVSMYTDQAPFIIKEGWGEPKSWRFDRVLAL